MREMTLHNSGTSSLASAAARAVSLAFKNSSCEAFTVYKRRYISSSYCSEPTLKANL